MTAFDKYDHERSEPVVVGMMMNDQICIWRDGEPSIWVIKSHKDASALRESLLQGQIGARSFRDGYYRTVADLDPESMVACFHTFTPFGSFGRYGTLLGSGHFVELSPLPRRRRPSYETPASLARLVEQAIVAASDFSSRRGDILVVSGHDVDGPAVTIGVSFRDRSLVSILSATPPPAVGRWDVPAAGESVRLVANLDPYVRDEIGELAWAALDQWGITPWDVVFTFISPIEQITGSLIRLPGLERSA